MKSDILLGILRHILSAAGVYIISAGVFDQATYDQISGSILVIAGLVWSAKDKFSRADTVPTTRPAPPRAASTRSTSGLPAILASAVAGILITGCATPQKTEQAAYRAIGSITTTVDHAMQAWGDYVRSGHASASDESRVRAAYEHYQRSIAVVRATALTVKTAPDGETALQTAVSTASAASADIVRLVQLLVTPSNPPK